MSDTLTAILPLDQWEAGLGRVGGGEKGVFRLPRRAAAGGAARGGG